MFIVGMISWWYTAGWKQYGRKLLESLSASEDFFSIDSLVRNLFAPFKQISATGYVGGTLQDKIRDWSDKQFSRFFGAIIRLLLIVVGGGWLIIHSIINILLLIMWPLIPILPLIGLMLIIFVGIPWSR